MTTRADVLDERRRCGLAVALNFGEVVFQINHLSRFWWFLLPNAGEFHRKHDKTDDPVADFTDPAIAELVIRFNL